MLTTTPYLRTRGTPPITVEYIISNKPPPSLATTLLTLTTGLLRALLSFAALLLLLSRLYPPPPTRHPAQQQQPATSTPTTTTDHLVFTLLSSPPGLLTTHLTTPLSTPALLALALLALYLSVLRLHTTESLLVLQDLGIQTSSSQRTLLAATQTRFIPAGKIQDVLVSEAFMGFSVRYVLVIVVAGEDDMVVVFPKLLPRKDVVLTVWRGVQKCLFKAEGEGVGNGNGNGKV